MILVTGGAGFIGSHLVKELLNNNETVVVIDDFNDYYNPEYKEQNILPFASKKNFTLIRGSITDKELVEQIFSTHPIHTVIHLAARAGIRASITHPHLYQETNIGGTLTILETMKKHGCNRFYFASSSSVYGNQHKVPFIETDDTEVPISPYAASKKASELFAHTYHQLYGIKTVGFRFFTAYGEGGRPDMAPYLFTKSILQGKPINKYGDGTTERDYTYVEDIVAGIVSALQKDFSYEIFNLGDSARVSLNKLIATIEESCGKKAIINQLPPQPGDVEKTCADIRKARSLLGYNPQTSIDEGIERFVSWFKKNRFYV